MHCLPAEHQRDLDRLPSYYWWHRHRIETVVNAVKRFLQNDFPQPLHYLDIGGGTGATTQAIVEALRDRLGMSLSPETTICLDGDPSLKTFQNSKPMTFEHADIDKEWNVQPQGFQLVTLLDVLEHVQKPVELLKRARSQMHARGIGVITVPAYAFLYSAWDVALGHKKRYTRQDLRQECRDAGLEVLWDSYLFSYMLPAALAKRLVFSSETRTAEFPKVPHAVDVLLRGAGTMERKLGRYVSIPFGTSVTAVVRPG